MMQRKKSRSVTNVAILTGDLAADAILSRAIQSHVFALVDRISLDQCGVVSFAGEV
jgi:hypothetical protein